MRTILAPAIDQGGQRGKHVTNTRQRHAQKLELRERFRYGARGRARGTEVP